MKPSFFLFAFGLFSLIQCTEAPDMPVEPVAFCRDFDDMRAMGKIVALTDASSTSYYVYKGVAIGFEYEMLNAFAKAHNLDLEIKLVEDMDCISDMLESGEGDIIAANYTITDDRQEYVRFSNPILQTRPCLIQRIPEEASQLSGHSLDSVLVREFSDLEGKSIHVRSMSSFFETLIKANSEHNSPFRIESVQMKTTEQLIAEVSNGEIDYTIADENVALLNRAYHPNIDIAMIIGDTQSVGWAVRKNAPYLLDTLNNWLNQYLSSREFSILETKYFRARSQGKKRVQSAYSSLGGKNISAYDNILKDEAQRIDWDWRLLAAIIKKESNFKPRIEASSGAAGLMQLIPATAAHFGADSVFDPRQNIHAGVSFIQALLKQLRPEITDSAQLVKFTLASYNAGLGHVKDARRLAHKYGVDDTNWEYVSHYLRQKSQPEFYNDPVVRHGYCRGYEPVQYVDRVVGYYEHYKNAFSD